MNGDTNGRLSAIGSFPESTGSPVASSGSPVAFRFAKKGEFVTRSIAGETILVPVRGAVGDLDAIFNLNEVGTFIWERLDGTATVGEIAIAVSGAFEVGTEQAAADTVEYLTVLESAGIVAQAVTGISRGAQSGGNGHA